MPFPAVFLNHGGGPLPLLGDPAHATLIKDFQEGGLLHSLFHHPSLSALVFVSAHHECEPVAGSRCVELVSGRSGSTSSSRSNSASASSTSASSTSASSTSASGSMNRSAAVPAPSPGLLFDYYGFPAETYRYELANPAFPAVAVERIKQQLSEHRFRSRTTDGRRGFDHGVFVPLLLVQAPQHLPVLQVSLAQSAEGGKFSARDHLELGRALRAALGAAFGNGIGGGVAQTADAVLAGRPTGEVMLVGSGMSFHNMGLLMQAISSTSSGSERLAGTSPSRGGGTGKPKRSEAAVLSETFAAGLEQMVADGDDAALWEWETLQNARVAHPREEHLLPLMVVRGFGGRDCEVRCVRGELAGVAYTHAVVGNLPELEKKIVGSSLQEY